MKPIETQETVRNLVLQVFETNGRLSDAGNALVKPLGLTTAWWQVLGALGYSSVPLPVAHIARNMGLTRQAVQRVTDLLVTQGFVRLEPNPHHRRAKLVVLTSAGHAVLKQAETAVRPLDQRILARIGEQRLAIAMEVLREMSAVLDETFGLAAHAGEPHHHNEE
ncbi:DNA-binding MarR family transcriptional regulator [Neorhizobium galegae]|uniref:MarR family winged helix-turn-helix transcriptional regulator n=1 Tax=Neorhizobium galegae TaxID=399 RepID=UPI001AE515CD|nr:MarR family transcriptional regulator [Neorhizobium galegae]MBP2549750.1 DNA-binding MarR family transcriptional regulator [Neorhizobium galegae]